MQKKIWGSLAFTCIKLHRMNKISERDKLERKAEPRDWGQTDVEAVNCPSEDEFFKGKELCASVFLFLPLC